MIGKKYNHKHIEEDYRNAANSIYHGTEFNPIVRNAKPAALPAGQTDTNLPAPQTTTKPAVSNAGLNDLAKNSIVAKFNKIPPAVRNALNDVVMRVAYNADQRSAVKDSELRPIINDGLNGIMDAKQKEVAKEVLDGFARNQSAIRDIAGRMHSHYNNKGNITRQGVTSALVHDFFNTAMEKGYSTDEIAYKLDNFVDDIQTSLYNGKTIDEAKDAVSKRIDNILDNLGGEQNKPEATTNDNNKAESKKSKNNVTDTNKDTQPKQNNAEKDKDQDDDDSEFLEPEIDDEGVINLDGITLPNEIVVEENETKSKKPESNEGKEAEDDYELEPEYDDSDDEVDLSNLKLPGEIIEEDNTGKKEEKNTDNDDKTYIYGIGWVTEDEMLNMDQGSYDYEGDFDEDLVDKDVDPKFLQWVEARLLAKERCLK